MSPEQVRSGWIQSGTRVVLELVQRVFGGGLEQDWSSSGVCSEWVESGTGVGLERSRLGLERVWSRSRVGQECVRSESRRGPVQVWSGFRVGLERDRSGF